MALICKEFFVDGSATVGWNSTLNTTLNHPVTRYSLIWECGRKHALQISQKYHESAYDRRDQCQKRV